MIETLEKIDPAIALEKAERSIATTFAWHSSIDENNSEVPQDYAQSTRVSYVRCRCGALVSRRYAEDANVCPRCGLLPYMEAPRPTEKELYAVFTGSLPAVREEWKRDEMQGELQNTVTHILNNTSSKQDKNEWLMTLLTYDVEDNNTTIH